MRLRLLAAASVMLASSLAAHAVPITYTVTDTGSGSLGSTSFTDALITVSFVGDTSTNTGSPGFYKNPVGVATVQVGSGPVATFTNPFFYDNQSSLGGVAGIAAGVTVLATSSDVFKTYTGTIAIGPITGAVYYNHGSTFATTSGTFVINSAGANSTFTATSGTSVTPEPSSLALLGTGLLGLAGAIRRRLA